MIFISVAFPQRQFANILHVKYADGYKLFNCDVLIDILCLDCGLLKVRANLFLPHYTRVCI